MGHSRISTSGRSSQMRVSFAKNIQSYWSDNGSITSEPEFTAVSNFELQKEAMMEYCTTNLTTSLPLRKSLNHFMTKLQRLSSENLMISPIRFTIDNCSASKRKYSGNGILGRDSEIRYK